VRPAKNLQKVIKFIKIFVIDVNLLSYFIIVFDRSYNISWSLFY